MGGSVLQSPDLRPVSTAQQREICKGKLQTRTRHTADRKSSAVRSDMSGNRSKV